MSSSQKLGPEQMLRTEKHIDHTISSMRSQVQDLENVIDMLKSHWHGGGGKQFRATQTELNLRHLRLQKTLDGIRDAIAATRKSGGANDADVATNLKDAHALHDSSDVSKLRDLS